MDETPKAMVPPETKRGPCCDAIPNKALVPIGYMQGLIAWRILGKPEVFLSRCRLDMSALHTPPNSLKGRCDPAWHPRRHKHRSTSPGRGASEAWEQRDLAQLGGVGTRQDAAAHRASSHQKQSPAPIRRAHSGAFSGSLTSVWLGRQALGFAPGLVSSRHRDAAGSSGERFTAVTFALNTFHPAGFFESSRTPFGPSTGAGRRRRLHRP